MPNFRKSDARHRRAGTFRPDRGHGRRGLTAGAGLGDAPPSLLADSEAVTVWEEIATTATWCGPADRLIAEVAARTLAALRRSPDPPAALTAQAQKALTALGLSPQARGETSSIVIERDEEPDPLWAAMGYPDGRPPSSKPKIAVVPTAEEVADRRAIQARKLEAERRRLALEAKKKDAN